MDTNTVKKLEKVLQDRMTLQVAQEHEMLESDTQEETPHTVYELLTFALEEAHQNGELDFLVPSTGEIRAKLYAHSPWNLGTVNDNLYRFAVDEGLKN